MSNDNPEVVAYKNLVEAATGYDNGNTLKVKLTNFANQVNAPSKVKAMTTQDVRDRAQAFAKAVSA